MLDAIRRKSKERAVWQFHATAHPRLTHWHPRKLAEKTQKDYRRYLDNLRDEFGALPIDALSDRRIRQDFFDWRDQYKDKPRTADYAWSILRRVLSFAYDRGKIDINHAIKPGRLYDSDRSDLIWLPEHVAKFCTVASDELKLAMILAIYTGQRCAFR